MRSLKIKVLSIICIFFFILGLYSITDYSIKYNYYLQNKTEEINDELIKQSVFSSSWFYEIPNIEEDELCSMAISSDGNFIVVGTGESSNPDVGTLFLFNSSNSEPLWSYSIGKNIDSVDISFDGSYIVAGSMNGYVYLFHKSSPFPIWTYTTGRPIGEVTISPDGEYIVAVDLDFYNTVMFFNKASSSPIWTSTRYFGGNPKDLKISLNGEVFAVCFDYSLYIFDSSSPEPLWSYSTGAESEVKEYISSLSISSDGSKIVIGSQNNKIYFFNKTSSLPEWVYTTDGDIYSVAMSLNGDLIVAGGVERKLHIINTSNSEPFSSIQLGGTIYSVLSSSDGKHITVGDDKGWLYLINLSSNWPLFKIFHLYTPIHRLAMSANGSQIIVGTNPFFNGDNARIHRFFEDNYITVDKAPYSNIPNNITLTRNELKTINWTLYDESFIETYQNIQCFHIIYNSNYTDINGVRYYHFNLKTNDYIDEYFSILNRGDSINPLFFKSIKICYTYGGSNIRYLDEDSFNIDYENKILTIGGDNDLSTINSADSFYVKFLADNLYRVYKDETLYIDWNIWNPNESLKIPVDSSEVGICNYKIQFFDKLLQYGNESSVFVSILRNPSLSQNNNLLIPGFDIFIFLGILISISIFTTFIRLNHIKNKFAWKKRD